MKFGQFLGVPLPDEDEIDRDKNDTFSPWIVSSENTSPLAYDLQFKTRKLCEESMEIFSNELPREPADIPPFGLDANYKNEMFIKVGYLRDLVLFLNKVT